MQTGRRSHPNRQPRDAGAGRGNNNSSSNSSSSNSRGRAPTNKPQYKSTRPQRPRAEYHSVPAFAAIKPGSGVSIILKDDQPTGHQVKGIVADLLTRGDHPRGVKVRLRDGRVGRVQGLVSEAEGETGEAVVGGAEAGLGRNGESYGRGVWGGRRGGGGGGGVGSTGARGERDARDEDEEEYLYDESRRETANAGYFAALEEADRHHEQSRSWSGSKDASAELATCCPVCEDFEGDVAAVAHHVEGHFAE